MTISCDSFDSDVMMSSVIPSAKYSCSASPDILPKGRTASDGFFGGTKVRAASGRTGCDFDSIQIRKARMGSTMFLTC
jgi:hypothetical protein